MLYFAPRPGAPSRRLARVFSRTPCEVSKRMDNRYIVVEGPIGVGKTSLSNMLSDRFSARRVFEIVEENPFLAQFYGDRQKFAFQTQIFFLLSRFRRSEEQHV